jgi:hypothetical protein
VLIKKGGRLPASAICATEGNVTFPACGLLPIFSKLEHERKGAGWVAIRADWRRRKSRAVDRSRRAPHDLRDPAPAIPGLRLLAAAFGFEACREGATQAREELRAGWLNFLEAYRRVEVAEGELIEKGVKRADAMRNLALMTLRNADATKMALDEGTFTDTWEQKQAAMKGVEGIERRRESFLDYVTAEDIRQLQRHGVLYER